MVYSIVNGKMMDLRKSLDKNIALGQLGKGCLFESEDGNIYSPVNGTVIMLFEQLHALGIEDEQGNQYLIHIGYDLARCNGVGLTVHIKLHEKITVHQCLITMDKKILQHKKSPLHIIFLVTKTQGEVHIEPIEHEVSILTVIGTVSMI